MTMYLPIIIALVLYFTGVLASGFYFPFSDTGLDAMTVGFTISSAAGLLFLSRAGNYLAGSRQLILRGIVRIISCGLFFLLLIIFCCHRFLGIYRDAPLSQLTTLLKEGPAAGLMTTNEHAEEYVSILKTIRDIHALYPDGHVVFSKTLPWAYLTADWGYGSPSAWRNNFQEDYFKAYYSLHPEKVPDLVFIFSPETAGYETAPFNNHLKNHNYNNNEICDWFYDTYLADAAILCETNCVKVYLINDSLSGADLQ